MPRTYTFYCEECPNEWDETLDTPRTSFCPCCEREADPDSASLFDDEDE
jgi:hypothetical protein